MTWSTETVRTMAAGQDTSSDYEKLLAQLKSKSLAKYLDNIPTPDRVEFSSSTLPNALPSKLFVGRQQNTNNKIYAYMQHSQRCKQDSTPHHQVNFYAENGDQKERILSKTLQEHKILPPFDKTLPEDPQQVTQNDRARLGVMVRWYFIAAGYAKNVVLKENESYPVRLSGALEYIAKRLGPSELWSPSVGGTPEVELPTTPLGCVAIEPAPFSAPVVIEEQLAVGRDAVNHTVQDTSLRGTKRPAKSDADIEHLLALAKGQLAKKRSHLQEIGVKMRDVEQERRLLEVRIGVLDEDWGGLEAERNKIVSSIENFNSALDH